MADRWSSWRRSRRCVNVFGKMAERKMRRLQLNERWKFAAANLFGALATRSKRTTVRQPRQIGRLSRNLMESPLLAGWIGHRTQQAAGVRISRPREELAGRSLLKN